MIDFETELNEALKGPSNNQTFEEVLQICHEIYASQWIKSIGHDDGRVVSPKAASAKDFMLNMTRSTSSQYAEKTANILNMMRDFMKSPHKPLEKTEMKEVGL